MKNNSVSLMLISVVTAGAVCLGVLTETVLGASSAEPAEEPEPQAVQRERGSIYDRRGVLLAGSSEGERYYPEALCPNILGTLSSDGSAQSGIELALDSELRRGDVYLSIDSRLQRTAEDILRTAAAQYEKGVSYDTAAPYCGSAGAVVILSCRSGEVLACASYPDYRLDSFPQDFASLSADESSPLLDRALQGLYRPGSPFKAVTAAAALCEGVISPETSFYCGARLRLGGTDFSCVRSHGYTNVSRALELSCNIFFYRTALLLGIERLDRYARLFGYGQAPLCELPTLGGQLASPDSSEYWGDGQLIQAAIGQSSMLCTPMQMALEALTVADRGRQLSPTFIRYGGIHEPVSVLRADRVFELITKAMTASSAYTYGDYALSQLEHPCAVKTGTPQSPRGYDSAVIGFYPADRPEIAFAVMLEGGANAKHAVYELCKAFEDNKE